MSSHVGKWVNMSICFIHDSNVTHSMVNRLGSMGTENL